LTVWALLVPQALAYGQLAGLDPVVGLYAALGAIVGYALLGGVREMAVGPEATIALLTVSVVTPLSAGDPVRYAALAGGLALVDRPRPDPRRPAPRDRGAADRPRRRVARPVDRLSIRSARPTWLASGIT
jgi:hypothetical protein